MSVTLASLIGTVSPNRLETAQRCLAQFGFRYVEKLKQRWSSQLSFGRAADDASNSSYKDKLRTGDTPSADDVKDRFAAAWDFEAENVDVWEEGETRGTLLDSGTAAMAVWRDFVAEKITPTHVQERLTVEVADPTTGETFGLLGIVDVRGSVTGRKVTADLKTSGKSWNPSAFVRNAQPAAYTILTGTPLFEYDVLVLTKQPRAQILRREITDGERTAFLRRAGMIRRQIANAYRTGDWLPNRTGFLCTRRHCDHWRECEKRFGGTVPA
jgi:hypothetical protein